MHVKWPNRIELERWTNCIRLDLNLSSILIIDYASPSCARIDSAEKKRCRKQWKYSSSVSFNLVAVRLFEFKAEPKKLYVWNLHTIWLCVYTGLWLCIYFWCWNLEWTRRCEFEAAAGSICHLQWRWERNRKRRRQKKCKQKMTIRAIIAWNAHHINVFVP